MTYPVKNTATFIITVSLGTVLFTCGACSSKKEKPRAKPPVPVAPVAIATQKDVPVQLKAIGNIEPYNSVAIKSQVNGQIARVHFKDGSDVQKGAPLITLDPESFEATLSQCARLPWPRTWPRPRFIREQADRYVSGPRMASSPGISMISCGPMPNLQPRPLQQTVLQSRTPGYSSTIATSVRQSWDVPGTCRWTWQSGEGK